MYLSKIIGGAWLLGLILLGNIFLARAQELSGTVFTDSNPVLTIQGGFSSSSNFQMFSGTGQTVIGESTSSAFIARLGFFYFPSSAVAPSPAVVVATPSAGGEGGSGAPGLIPAAAPENVSVVLFSGLASPGSVVTILRDGVVIQTTRAGADGFFSLTLDNLSAGLGIFTIFATDANAIRTAPVSFLLTLVAGQTRVVDEILLPPSINSDKETVRFGEPITIFGFTAPNSEVAIFDEQNQPVLKTKSDPAGRFVQVMETKKLRLGEQIWRVKTAVRGQPSDWSRPIKFFIGERTLPRPAAVCQLEIGDFNCDIQVDLVDFSILLYWFYRPNPPFTVDLNHDNRVDIIDFSIMMYNWTG